MLITSVQPNELITLLEIWEASVRATHHFLTEQAIQELKPQVLNDYLPMVTLFCSRTDNQKITGFAGIHDNKLEMLFIDPSYRGLGLGKALLKHAIEHFQVKQLEVNEQNPQAIAFYQKQGFEVVGRSPLDGQGNPYPLLHMRIITN
ncbi:acetyltransferase [Entomomonas asaccharolytica]|uniref:Acetyltransferase n=1 Tax=Entomomonas asaccharolytica TaxID=2785331 RepID=A0A974RXK4_9GAMM|nr:acetyltransferase [Entomomonas asaccharolytica]QQP86361.1 acetyltransferase [Entomomonas asaccharolytica]